MILECNLCNKEIIDCRYNQKYCSDCRTKGYNLDKKEQLKKPDYKISHSRSVKKWQENHKEKMREISRVWKKRHEKHVRKYEKDYQTNNKDKTFARQIARKIKVNPECIVCSNSHVEKHHIDYNLPNFVIPVCRTHHVQFNKLDGVFGGFKKW